MWSNTQSSSTDSPDNKNFDEVGDYRNRNNLHQTCFFYAKLNKEPNLDETIETFISCNNATTKTNEPECKLMKTLFNLLPLGIINKSL